MGILLTLLMIALAGPVEFDRTVYDFGEMSIKDGPQKCEFVVKNVGDKPFSILSAVTSCGCTEVKWTRTGIEPGSSGTVSVVYANDEGPTVFNKTVTVYTTAEKMPYVLHIRGKVTNRKKSK